MKVTVNEWIPVAVWKWPHVDNNDDVCGICRSQFEATCPSCLKPGHGCPPLSGRCSHSFHQHCIEKWLKREESEWSCPMCRRPFVAVHNDESGSDGDEDQDFPMDEDEDEDDSDSSVVNTSFED